MAQPTTQTGIVNNALTRIGSNDRLVSFDTGGGNTGERARALWDDLRRLLLAMHPWNFAIARAPLNAASAAPEFGYTRKFQLPADCLRWLPPGDRREDHYFDGELEGRFILTDAVAPLRIRYIRDHTTVSEWSPGFVMAMTQALAEWLSEPVTQSVGMTDRMVEMAERAVKVGKRLDGLETGRRRMGGVVARSDWLAARHRAYPGNR